MGGSLASLLGATFGVPVVAFEAPGEKLAASRLHLPLPVRIFAYALFLLIAHFVQPSLSHITHVYHTGDPIPQGACTGVSSVCSIGGFALETKCHLGKVIRYDTVTRLGWSVDSRSHGIDAVIDRVIGGDYDWSNDTAKDDEPKQKREVPEPIEETDCIVSMTCHFSNWQRLIHQ